MEAETLFHFISQVHQSEAQAAHLFQIVIVTLYPDVLLPERKVR